MKTILYSFKNKKFFIQETPLPEIKKGEVLVKIKISALCGTDLHIMAGDLSKKVYSPKEIVLGHEWAGIVVQTGSQAKNFKKGDWVFGSPHLPCGRCFNCRQDRANWCDKPLVFGLNVPGSLTEYLAVRETVLFPLPKKIGWQAGVLLSDTISTAYHAIKRVELKSGQRILILGAGPVGLALGIFSRFLGGKEVFVMETEKYRLKLAKKLFGAKEVEKTNFVKARRSFDCVFETTGSARALEYGIQALKRGGRLALVGIHKEKYSLDALRLMYRELTILGCFGYTRQEAKEFTRLLGRSQKLKNDLEKIITHRFSLKDAALAYRIFQSKKSGKVILFC